MRQGQLIIPIYDYQDHDLKNPRNKEFTDRRSAAADAKATLLTAFRAAKAAAEPSQLARQAERISVVEARDARRAERDRLKLEECTRLETLAAEQQTATETAAAAETTARALAENARISRVVEDEAARKVERDRRYANRKARQA